MLKPTLAVALSLALVLSRADAAPLVSLTTPLGQIVVNLFEDKPVTVTNFLAYIESGRYANSFSHRLIPGFVIQGGGYFLDQTTVFPVTTYAPIANEYSTGQIRSNLYGTIAMAKQEGNPDSATSQWFFNLADNTNLDTQNGGFTVFGEVISGLEILSLFNTTFSNPSQNNGRGVYNATTQLGGDFSNMPLLAPFLSPANLIYTTWAVVPEPSAILLALGGLGLLGALRRRASRSCCRK